MANNNQENSNYSDEFVGAIEDAGKEVVGG